MDNLYIFSLIEGSNITDEYNVVISDSLEKALEIFAQGSRIGELKVDYVIHDDVTYTFNLYIEVDSDDMTTRFVDISHWYVTEISGPERNKLY